MIQRNKIYHKKKEKKVGISKATEAKAINNKIIKTIVIPEMMGKIKEEQQANPLGEIRYYVDLNSISNAIDEIGKALKISEKNDNEGFEKIFLSFGY